jgi:proteic killer suppression protein
MGSPRLRRPPLGRIVTGYIPGTRDSCESFYAIAAVKEHLDWYVVYTIYYYLIRGRMAITGCKDKRTERFLAGERVREFQAFADAAARALTKLQAAVILGDLRDPPSNRFEALQRDRKGQYSIRINEKNRVCFKWAPHASVPAGTDALQVSGNAYDVEIVIDYH